MNFVAVADVDADAVELLISTDEEVHSPLSAVTWSLRKKVNQVILRYRERESFFGGGGEER